MENRLSVLRFSSDFHCIATAAVGNYLWEDLVLPILRAFKRSACWRTAVIAVGILVSRRFASFPEVLA
ncbi:MAG: hypothetical protein P8L78_18650 [Mariniblastus sp.]|nr:hypothetical protein [Mariniblastus sp.]